MFSWMGRDDSQKRQPEMFMSVVEGLKQLYKTEILPLEEHYLFHEFHSPPLEDADFDAKPMILLVGQYSTGKTTFIKYLIKRDFPGIRIGPEPTTDRFIAVMAGETDRVIPGNALVVDPKRQFRPLAKFGNAFLNRFQCSVVKSPVLENITVIDTPGILSGEKQRVDRGYDFTGVLEWFAERVDRIILLFDAHKLDISDEFRRSIEALRGHDDKIMIVLNKADMVDHQQLMRVYGALMWSLGKVLATPEVARVYIGSFWDQPLRYDANCKLFEAEKQDMFADMQSLPRNAVLRKLNDLIKRARLAKVHAFIISSLGDQMPAMFGKTAKKNELIKHLSTIYSEIERDYHIPVGDFPDMKEMQEKLLQHDFEKFNPMKKHLVDAVDKMLADDISRLMSMIPHEQIIEEQNEISVVKGGAFEVSNNKTPFGFGRGEGIDAGAFECVIEKDKEKCNEVFLTLTPVDGKITGAAAKAEMVKCKIWKLPSHGSGFDNRPDAGPSRSETSNDWREDTRGPSFQRDQGFARNGYSQDGHASQNRSFGSEFNQSSGLGYQDRSRGGYDRQGRGYDGYGSRGNDYSGRGYDHQSSGYRDSNYGQQQGHRQETGGYSSHTTSRYDYQDTFSRKEFGTGRPRQEDMSRKQYSHHPHPSDHQQQPSPAVADPVPEAPKERPKLQLKRRTKPIQEIAAPAETTSTKSNPFGGARPVDTSSREMQIEEKLKNLDMKQESSSPTQPDSETRPRKSSTSSSGTRNEQPPRRNMDLRGGRGYSGSNSFNRSGPRDVRSNSRPDDRNTCPPRIEKKESGQNGASQTS